MKSILKKMIVMIMAMSVFGFAQQEIQVFTSDNSDGTITPTTIEEAFVKAGFFVSSNRNMNEPFQKQFNETSFDVYNLLTFFSKDDTLTLAKKNPEIGLFSPMSMSIYTRKGDKTISIATLSVETMATILNMPKDDETLVKLGEMVKSALKAAMPKGSFETLSYEPVKIEGDRVTRFEAEVDPEEWEDIKDEFSMGFEGELAPNGFIKAGFNDLNEDFEEKNYEEYYFYDVYSICKLPVIYTVAKIKPEAGAFAPCSLYHYMKKGDDKMHLAFPSVYNWISALALDDPAAIDTLKDAQKRMETILSGLLN